jgi:hypothetical protein
MAGTIIADKIQTENAFLTLNVGATQIATMNSSGIYSSSGTKMIGTDGTIGVATIANTAITGNIISSQIAPSVTLTTPIISGNLNLDSAGTSGIRLPAANTISFHTAGTEDMRIDSSGRVGIGVSSPAKALSVYAADGYIQMLNASTGTATGDGAFIGVEGGTTALRIVNQENDVMSFSTNGLANERMRIDASGRVLIGLTSPNTSGANFQVSSGITFPASQSASSDANTLDDYEEGTFTPIIIGGSTAGTGTYNTQSGSYTKVGRLVSFRLQVFWSAHTGTGGLFVGSLPFTCSGIGGGTIGLLNDLTLTASNYAMSDIVDGATTVRFRQYPVGGGTITDVAMDSAANIVLSGTYFTT